MIAIHSALPSWVANICKYLIKILAHQSGKEDGLGAMDIGR